MFTTKLLATLGLAGALLLGATTGASARPWRGPIRHVPVYRPAPVVYRPAPVVYVPPAPVYVPPAPVVVVPPAYPAYAPAPVVYRAPVVYHAPVYRPWVRHGRW